jgi:hypothetical protein
LTRHCGSRQDPQIFTATQRHQAKIVNMNHIHAPGFRHVNTPKY